MLGGDSIADGERSFGVDCAAVDEDFVGEGAGEDAFGFGQVDGSDVASFGDHGDDDVLCVVSVSGSD